MTALAPSVVYILCLLTSAVCALLLVRAYGRNGAKLLLWSAIAFVLLAFNNLFVVLDMILLREIDFAWARQGCGLAAVGVLLYAFIWELD
jgi:hypothetical protein